MVVGGGAFWWVGAVGVGRALFLVSGSRWENILGRWVGVGGDEWG